MVEENHQTGAAENQEPTAQQTNASSGRSGNPGESTTRPPAADQQPPDHSGATAEPLSTSNKAHDPSRADSTGAARLKLLGQTLQGAATRIASRARSLTAAQMILLAGIILVAIILLCALFGTGRPGGPRPAAAARRPQRLRVNLPTQLAAARSNNRPDLGTIPSTEPAGPSSLKTAEDLFSQRQYARAYSIYENLAGRLGSDADQQLLADLLNFKMALCLIEASKAGDIVVLTDGGPAGPDVAVELLQLVAGSRSPAVMVAANYNLSLIELRHKRYLKARCRAYQAMALADAVDFGVEWLAWLRRNCRFIAAQSLTMAALGLCDADKDLPPQLWDQPPGLVDPFLGLSMERLQALLNSGRKQLARAVLSPYIKRIDPELPQQKPGPATRWEIASHSTPIQELLARFAAHAGLDTRWLAPETDSDQPLDEIARRRPVTLCSPSITTKRLPVIAAGCAGLLAVPRGDGTVEVYDPGRYRSLSEQIEVLCRRAVALWREFMVQFRNDQRIANAHFAIALLQAQIGRQADALAEYKLVANHYSHTPLAPYALLYSGRLKTTLGDYVGAREDLEQLVQQYNDSRLSASAYLHLAEVTEKNGQLGLAAQLYSKVYNMRYGSDSQASAALGAGRCFYNRRNHENAAVWLRKYLELAADRKDDQFYNACLLLGKTNLALGKPDQACKLLSYALAQQPGGKQYWQLVSATAQAYTQKENFVEALNVLEAVRPWQLSRADHSRLVILKSQILRRIGLVDEAMATIGDRPQYETDPHLKAAILLELALCNIAKDRLEQATTLLSEAVTLAEPGRPASEIALTLAEVCLKLGQNTQAINLCRQLLQANPSGTMKHRALQVLSKAYKEQGQYDKAIWALTGQPQPDGPIDAVVKAKP